MIDNRAYGIMLLTKVREQYPKILRFIMSENITMIDKINDIANFCFTKPLNLSSLKNAILKPAEFLDKNKIKIFISKMDKLPTIPRLYVELKEVLRTNDYSLKDIAIIIEKDVNMTAKILQIVNSAYFSLKYRIYDILHAVIYLGVEAIKSLVLTLNIFHEFSSDEMRLFNINDLYSHSLAVSCLVSSIVQSSVTEDKMAEESSVSGMLHDIGKLVFIKNKQDIYKNIFEEYNTTGTPIYLLEKQNFGVTHADIGGFLAEEWEFSANLVESITSHHNPDIALANGLNTNAAVYLANIIDHNPDSLEIFDESGKIMQIIKKSNQTDDLLLWCSLANKLKNISLDT
ncbi:HDOD domain-containing protein [Candidatus Desantisbacteria bacterium]|nr:HDOD domain-containing protein [Candidatus Desantisbacteria bacterium]